MMGKSYLRLLIPGMFSQQSRELYVNDGELDVSCLHLSINVSLCVPDCILLSLAPQDQLSALPRGSRSEVDFLTQPSPSPPLGSQSLCLLDIGPAPSALLTSIWQYKMCLF